MVGLVCASKLYHFTKSVTPRPPTANGPPTPALSARGPIPFQRSVTHPPTIPAQARLTLEFFQDVLRKRSQDASQVRTEMANQL
ncbi:hypothetical protein YC2023_059142 [Brassica napus]